MATIEETFDVVCKTFRISALNAPQKNGITKIVEERRDVFINLPTGFGEERCVTILKTAARESSRKMGVLRHYDSFWTTFPKTTFPKIKEKNINLRKNKNKKFIFFIGQEIKKPDLSGQNRSNPQNPDKTGQIRSNPEILPRTLTLAHFGPL